MRKYKDIICVVCDKQMRVRSDYASKHSGTCVSCQKLNNKNSLKHGASGTRLYNIWVGLKQRRYKAYKPDICNEWNEFESFRKWSVNNGYKNHLTIDRINNKLGYSPDNCQWITLKENAGKDKNIFTYEEKISLFKFRKDYSLTQMEMAILLGVSRNTIQRLEKQLKEKL